MIYLDSAATTLQKPVGVSRACARAVNHLASPGRGGHRPAMAAADTAFACREAAAELFQVSEPEQVVFTFNATHALNIAIKSLVKPGMTVLISGYEHNAVTRPLNAISDVTVRVAHGKVFDQEAILDSFRRKLTSNVDVVVCTHVSNVFGFILPIQEIAQLCRTRGVPLIIDAAQSAGCLPLSQRELGAAFIAMPGHKGLYGPQGTGLLLCGESTVPLMEGGTGSESIKQQMPEFLPDRLEAGTHNVTGIAGLLEGIRYVQCMGVARISAHEEMLIQRMGRGLVRLPQLRVYLSRIPEAQVGALSFQVEGQDCEEFCERLGDRGFALRAGLHCAPTAHQTVGTLEDGTLRASVSAFNTRQEIDQFVRTVAILTK